jgi:hypothetical protein
MKLSHLTPKTGNELNKQGCKYFTLLTTVNRNNKKYLLYEPTTQPNNNTATIADILKQCGTNEVYICI